MGKKKRKFAAREKSVQKMTRDGLITENRATGETSRISSRTAEKEFHPHGSASKEPTYSPVKSQETTSYRGSMTSENIQPKSHRPSHPATHKTNTNPEAFVSHPPEPFASETATSTNTTEPYRNDPSFYQYGVSSPFYIEETPSLHPDVKTDSFHSPKYPSSASHPDSSIPWHEDSRPFRGDDAKKISDSGISAPSPQTKMDAADHGRLLSHSSEPAFQQDHRGSTSYQERRSSDQPFKESDLNVQNPRPRENRRTQQIVAKNQQSDFSFVPPDRQEPTSDRPPVREETSPWQPAPEPFRQFSNSNSSHAFAAAAVEQHHLIHNHEHADRVADPEKQTSYREAEHQSEFQTARHHTTYQEHHTDRLASGSSSGRPDSSSSKTQPAKVHQHRETAPQETVPKDTAHPETGIYYTFQNPTSISSPVSESEKNLRFDDDPSSRRFVTADSSGQTPDSPVFHEKKSALHESRTQVENRKTPAPRQTPKRQDPVKHSAGEELPDAFASHAAPSLETPPANMDSSHLPSTPEIAIPLAAPIDKDNKTVLGHKRDRVQQMQSTSILLETPAASVEKEGKLQETHFTGSLRETKATTDKFQDKNSPMLKVSESNTPMIGKSAPGQHARQPAPYKKGGRSALPSDKTANTSVPQKKESTKDITVSGNTSKKQTVKSTAKEQTTAVRDNGVVLNHRTAPIKYVSNVEQRPDSLKKKFKDVPEDRLPEQTDARKKQIRRTYQEQANKKDSSSTRKPDADKADTKTGKAVPSNSISSKAPVLQTGKKKPSRLKERPPNAYALHPESVSPVLITEKKRNRQKLSSKERVSITKIGKQADQKVTSATVPSAETALHGGEEKSNRFRSIHAQTTKDNTRDGNAKKNAKKKKPKNRLQEKDPKAARGRSKFHPDAGDISGKPGVIGSVKKGAGKATGKAAVAAASMAGMYLRGKFHEAGEENAGIEAAERTEYLTEQGVRSINHRVKSISAKNREGKRSSRLKESFSESENVFHTGELKPRKQKPQKQNPLNQFFQKQRNKKRAKEAAKAAREGGKAAKTAAKSAASFTEKATKTIHNFFRKDKTVIYAGIAFGLLVILLISQLQSCSMIFTQTAGTVAASSWPADDTDITQAELYYSQLEAELQKKIDTVESTYPGYDEYNYNVGEIGHDPVALISYLCAKYGDFTFDDTIKQELNTIFNLQYSYDVKTVNESRTVTKNVQAGESLGTVVTSAYCSCSICCGKWSGGPTASGAYPTANHTLAVDAYNPIVPMGTQVIMNGTLYVVEDTGNLNANGVDFDVYYDSHSDALNHGHKTFEAYYAGGDGEAIAVTTTENVRVCYVTLSSNGLTSVLSTRMDDEQKELYDIYVESRGNRQFLGSPIEGYWYSLISSHYGYRTTNGITEMHNGLDITPTTGTEILAVQDGTVTSIGTDSAYGKYIVIENDDGYKTLYAHCQSVSVSQGQAVNTGDVIGKVGSSGNVSAPTLHIEFQYNGDFYNPYFYLSCDGASLSGSVGNATGAAAALIQEAQKHLGTPYVWGGYSPSGFDCSGYVSYCLTYSGARNTGRLTANGLLDICTNVSKSQLQPGDLVFFQGTYNTSGASHVGIYIGSGEYGTGTFIHCGDPCKYGDLNSSYWTQHWLTGGRWY